MLRAAWRSLLEHKLRLVLSTLAIILSVGFVVGTLIFTNTLNQTFTDLFAQTTTDVVITPESEVTGTGFAGELRLLEPGLVKDVSEVDGVAKAAGVIFADGVSLIDADGEPVGQAGAPNFGSNWTDDEELTPYRLIDGRGPATAGEVAVDSVSAEAAGFAVGDQIQLVTPSGQTAAELVGIFRFGTSGNLAGATIAAFDTATAQELMLDGNPGYTEIDAVADDGVSQDTLAERVSEVTGSGVAVQTGEEAADDAASDITEALGFFNVILLTFALIALFVGSFLILNTFSILISQRTRELALLRAVGATRGQVMRSVLTESFVVGLIASLLGCVFGVGVVYALTGLFAQIGLELGTGPALSVTPFVVGTVLGVGLTVLASAIPARRASRIPPMAALRDDATLPTRSLTVRAIVGGTVTLVGVAALLAGVSAGNAEGASLVGLGTLLMLVGVIVFSPVLAAPVARVFGAPLPTLFGTVGRLAMDNAARQPRRTAATASALMIGMALVSALTIFAISISDSLNASIDRVVGAEFIVSNAAQRPFPASIADQIEDLDNVSTVARTTFATAQVSGDDISTTETFVSGVQADSISEVLTLDFTQGSLADLDDSNVLVDATTATNNKLSVGDSVTLTFPTGEQDFEISGLYEPSGFFSGYVVTTDALVAAGLSAGDTFVYVKATEGADLADVRSSIETVLADYPTVEVQSQAELKEQIQSNVNTLLGIMVLLLGLAIFIAVLGIVNTLLLSVLERTREIGMLRAVGALRSQIRGMVVLEAIVIALFGAVIGVTLGIVFAAALQQTLADQGIDVLTIPWLALILFLIVAAVVGTLAALWPAYRAGKLDVLRAVTTE